jgi:hypothetical protein
MCRTGARATLAVLLLMTVLSPSIGGEYRDSTGFSFTYPDGWATGPVFGKDELIPLAVKAEDLNNARIALVRKGTGDFLENLNVVVYKRGEIPINAEAVREITARIPQVYGRTGITIDQVEGRVREIRGRQAVVVDFRARHPNLPFPTKVRQVAFAGGGNTYIVTCGARTENFSKYEPVFDGILASFQFPAPAPAGGPFEWLGINWMRVVSYVCSVMGILTFLRKWANARKRAAAAADRPPQPFGLR